MRRVTLAAALSLVMTVAAMLAQQRESDVRTAPLGAISGRVLDHFGDPLPGVSVVALRRTFSDGLLRFVVAAGGRPEMHTDDLGRFRLHSLGAGDYYVVAAAGALTALPPFLDPGEAGGFLPTFFPASPTVGSASKVRLGAGEEREGLTIAMLPGRGVRVSGRAVDSTGQPFARALMSLSAVDAAAGGVLLAGRDQTDAGGTFAFSNVPPGRYLVQARSLGTAGTLIAEFGWTEVGVGDADVADLLVRTSEGSVVNARVTVETSQPTGTFPKGATVAIVPADLATQPVLRVGEAPITVTLDEDLRMQFTKLWGRYLFRPLRGEWLLERVVVDGRDVTDVPVELTGQAIEAEIVLSDNAATISGLVLDDRAAPAGGSTVIVFATDRERWTPRSRFVHVAEATGTGEFVVRGVHPGRYFAVGIRAVDPGAWADPEWLDRLAASAASFPVVARETRRIDVSLSR
jgi:hypothetical protein